MLKLRDDERQRIGQELHDSAGQLLTSLQLSVACLRSSPNKGSDEQLIHEIQDTARLIGDEIRSLAFLNHPIRLGDNGVASALQALIDGFGRRTGFRTSFRSTGHGAIDQASSMALLRIAQEALVNIHRHAQASRVAMSIKAQQSRVHLTIRDDGIGLPGPSQLATNGGVGVQGMRFRVEQLGGLFEISSSKRGTRISAIVPAVAPAMARATAG